MKKFQSNDEDISVIQAAMMGQPTSLVSSSVQEQLAQILLEKYQKDIDEENRKKSIRKKQQEVLAKEAQAKREEELRIQESCDHKKPNGTTALVASYNHHGEIMGICQTCGKEWLKNSIPQHLLPPGEAIGGPGVR
jgi:hypothetical protein